MLDIADVGKSGGPLESTLRDDGEIGLIRAVAARAATAR